MKSSSRCIYHIEIGKNELEVRKLWPPAPQVGGHFFKKTIPKQLIAYFQSPQKNP
jgi:hypothetical protein